ncbi:MAG: hypothetical protein QM608_00090 [Caulobacter sp.]
MLLSAMFLAAAVQGVPADRVHDLVEGPGIVPEAKAAPLDRIEDGRVVRPLVAGCSPGKVAAAETPKGEDPARPLSKEPRSGLRHAVMRSVDGCPVDAPMVVNRKK